MADIVRSLTVGKLINGDRIMVDGQIATITEIRYFDEPLVRLYIHTERFGNTSILTTDDAVVEMAPFDPSSVKFGYGDLLKGGN